MARRIAAVSAGIVVLIALCAIAVYLARPSAQLQNASQAPIVGKAQVGQRAPEFAVPTTGGYFDLKKTSKPVFLEVFATWCPHCQRETSVIDRLYVKYGSRVDFVGVSGSNTAIDGTSESSQVDVLNWVQRFGVRYPVAYDPTLAVANGYLQGGFPTFALIDANKTVVYLDSGEIAYGDLAAQIEKLLTH